MDYFSKLSKFDITKFLSENDLCSDKDVVKMSYSNSLLDSYLQVKVFEKDREKCTLYLRNFSLYIKTESEVDKAQLELEYLKFLTQKFSAKDQKDFADNCFFDYPADLKHFLSKLYRLDIKQKIGLIFPANQTTGNCIPYGLTSLRSKFFEDSKSSIAQFLAGYSSEIHSKSLGIYENALQDEDENA